MPFCPIGYLFIVQLSSLLLFFLLLNSWFSWYLFASNQHLLDVESSFYGCSIFIWCCALCLAFWDSLSSISLVLHPRSFLHCHVGLGYCWTSRCALGHSWSPHLCTATTESGWPRLQCGMTVLGIYKLSFNLPWVVFVKKLIYTWTSWAQSTLSTRQITNYNVKWYAFGNVPQLPFMNPKHFMLEIPNQNQIM